MGRLSLRLGVLGFALEDLGLVLEGDYVVSKALELLMLFGEVAVGLGDGFGILVIAFALEIVDALLHARDEVFSGARFSWLLCSSR